MWRRRLVILVTLVLVLTTAPIEVLAQPGVIVIPNGNAINVRSGPGPEYTVRAMLYSGTPLPADGRAATDDCPDGWLRVALTGSVEGWVNACAVTVIGDAAALPLAEPAFPILVADLEMLPVLSNGGAWSPDNMAMLTVVVGTTLLFEQPSITSSQIGSISAGAQVELVARDETGQWLLVRFGPTAGWTAAFLVAVTPEQRAELTTYRPDDRGDDVEPMPDALIFSENCQNPPPDWAPAHGWRRKCEDVARHTYEPGLPPGQQKKDD